MIHNKPSHVFFFFCYSSYRTKIDTTCQPIVRETVTSLTTSTTRPREASITSHRVSCTTNSNSSQRNYIFSRFREQQIMSATVETLSLTDSSEKSLSEPQLSSKSATPRSIPESVPSITSLPSSIPSNSSAAYTRMPLDTNSNGQRDGGITFASQDKLPKLPIPDLASTCDKYLEALRPLQSPRERAETEFAVRDFLTTDGPDLQERLKKYAQGKTSYIEQFCQY